MKLCILDIAFSVCQTEDFSLIDPERPYVFPQKTRDEHSLVCPTEAVPANCIRREDGWRAFYIAGVLDFSLIGILAGISSVLADAGIGIFALSTYNTDYIFVKEEALGQAVDALSRAGYNMEEET